jgi:hypothetical protein
MENQNTNTPHRHTLEWVFENKQKVTAYDLRQLYEESAKKAAAVNTLSDWVCREHTNLFDDAGRIRPDFFEDFLAQEIELYDSGALKAKKKQYQTPLDSAAYYVIYTYRKLVKLQAQPERDRRKEEKELKRLSKRLCWLSHLLLKTRDVTRKGIGHPNNPDHYVVENYARGFGYALADADFGW